MWILMLEALAALFLFVFIVWWTMFSGKKPPRRPMTTQEARNEQKIQDAAQTNVETRQEDDQGKPSGSV